MADERRYSEEEVRAILERAIRQDQSGGLSHADLVEAAREVGISDDAVEQAALEVEQGRELELARERILARRRAGFKSHLVVYVAVMLFLFAINALTSPQHWWFLYPLLGWGLGMVFSARAGLSKQVSERALAREVARSSSPRRIAEGRQPSRRVGRIDPDDEASFEDESRARGGRERTRRRS
jgi:hypothetical protein